MSSSLRASDPGEPVFAIDKRVRKALLPYRGTKAAKAAGWLSQGGDQLQLRLLAVGTLAIGLVRRDARIAEAGVRMLLAHEAATLAKDFVKRRVIRERPRSSGGRHPKPRRGHDTRKENSSFPSGHSAGAFAVATAFAGVYPRHAGQAKAAAGAVALGRLPGCAHYPSDIAAGGAIGVLAGWLVNAAWTRLFRGRGTSA